jgi:hypothetical protein
MPANPDDGPAFFVDLNAWWLLATPGDADVPGLVGDWVDRRPELKPHHDRLVDVYGSAVRNASDATAVGMLALPVKADLYTGLLFAYLGDADLPTHPDDLLTAVRAENPMLADGAGDSGLVTLAGGGMAARVRLLDLPQVDGLPVPPAEDADDTDDTDDEDGSIFDTLRYFVPHPSADLLAELVFQTGQITVGDALVDQADQVLRTFRWGED